MRGSAATLGFKYNIKQFGLKALPTELGKVKPVDCSLVDDRPRVLKSNGRKKQEKRGDITISEAAKSLAQRQFTRTKTKWCLLVMFKSSVLNHQTAITKGCRVYQRFCPFKVVQNYHQKRKFFLGSFEFQRKQKKKSEHGLFLMNDYHIQKIPRNTQGVMRDVSFSVVSESRHVLLTQAELLNDSTITLNVLALEVVKERAALTYHLNE